MCRVVMFPSVVRNQYLNEIFTHHDTDNDDDYQLMSSSNWDHIVFVTDQLM
ncbi:unnamed protein product, partial [Rotaria magnacalcarata]